VTRLRTQEVAIAAITVAFIALLIVIATVWVNLAQQSTTQDCINHAGHGYVTGCVPKGSSK
jgi:hypothetical protein